MKILVADDDAVSRLILQRMLRQAGYQVVLADNGHAAIESLLSHNGPRLALLDWMMPGLDGPTVCREVRKCPERGYVYITVLTSREAKEDLVAGLEAGADDYLIKPCNTEELKARLRAGQRILQLEDTLVEAREEMRFKATHDPLTLLWNREKILFHLNVEIERARRGETVFSLLLCDIDHFKRINDKYGHLVGDRVLREMAERLRSATGDRDAVGRYGGEEFLILLSGCGRDALPARAEAICKAVNASSFLAAASPVLQSISLGALTVDASNIGLRFETLLSQADIALYRAKMEGRNRAVILEPCLAQDKDQIMPKGLGLLSHIDLPARRKRRDGKHSCDEI